MASAAARKEVWVANDRARANAGRFLPARGTSTELELSQEWNWPCATHNILHRAPWRRQQEFGRADMVEAQTTSFGARPKEAEARSPLRRARESYSSGQPLEEGEPDLSPQRSRGEAPPKHGHEEGETLIKPPIIALFQRTVNKLKILRT